MSCEIRCRRSRIVRMRRSTHPVTRWPPTGLYIAFMLLFLHKILCSLLRNSVSWSVQMERGMPLMAMYLLKNFRTFGADGPEQIFAQENLEKRSTATNMYMGQFDEVFWMGPQKSSWISELGSGSFGRDPS